MARALVQLFPMQMAMLGLFEFIASFLLIFAMLTAGAPASLLESTNLPHDCLILAAMLAVTIAATAATIGVYRPEICLDRRRFLLSGVTAALLAFPAVLLVSGAYRMTLSGDHVIWLARLLVVWLLFMLLVRYGFGALTLRVPMTRRILIVGEGNRAALLHRRLASKRHALFEVITPRTMPSAPVTPAGKGETGKGEGRGGALSLQSLREQRIWGVVVVQGEAEPEIQAALLDSKLRGVPVYSDISFHETHLGRIEPTSVDAQWLLCAEGFRAGRVAEAVKRLGDIAVSLTLMIMTLPLMLITALLIKLDSPGPLLYRQERTGLHGKPFTLLKFRSMTADAEAAGKPQWAQKRDPRVTRVGAFIRASRIDELPQLLNVLHGEMSMIGPRPERPVFVEQLAEAIPLYNHRACVRPGLTGWAQVNFPYGASIEDAREKLAYDLYYVKNRGMLLDMVILLSTVRVILFREGAR